MKLNLVLYRKLDVNRLSEEAVEYLEKHEGSSELVLADRPRDVEWTEEIMTATCGYAVATEDGEVLAEFEEGQLADALAAIKGAKIKLQIEVPGVTPRTAKG